MKTPVCHSLEENEEDEFNEDFLEGHNKIFNSINNLLCTTPGASVQEMSTYMCLM